MTEDTFKYVNFSKDEEKEALEYVGRLIKFNGYRQLSDSNAYVEGTRVICLLLSDKM